MPAAATESTSLPPIGSGAATAGAPLDLGKLLGETLSRLIGESRAAGDGEPLLTADEHGRVSYDAFKTAVTSLGLSVSEGRRIFQHFDKEGTGFLDFKELHSEVRAASLAAPRRAPRENSAVPLPLARTPPALTPTGRPTLRRTAHDAGQREELARRQGA